MQVPGSESDPDLHAKQQATLFAAALRTMALPLGRGALMLGLAEPLPGACCASHVAYVYMCSQGAVLPSMLPRLQPEHCALTVSVAAARALALGLGACMHTLCCPS